MLTALAILLGSLIIGGAIIGATYLIVKAYDRNTAALNRVEQAIVNAGEQNVAHVAQQQGAGHAMGEQYNLAQERIVALRTRLTTAQKHLIQLRQKENLHTNEIAHCERVFQTLSQELAQLTPRPQSRAAKAIERMSESVEANLTRLREMRETAMRAAAPSQAGRFFDEHQEGEELEDFAASPPQIDSSEDDEFEENLNGFDSQQTEGIRPL